MRKGKNGVRRMAALLCAVALTATLLPAQVLALDGEPSVSSTGNGAVITDVSAGAGEEDGPSDPAPEEEKKDNTAPEKQDPEEEKEPAEEAGAAADAGSGEETTQDPEGEKEPVVETPSDTEQPQEGGTDPEGPTAGDEGDAVLPEEEPGQEGPSAGPAVNNSLVAPLSVDDVAKIGDTTYETLDEAIEQVQAGGTITLLSDATVSKTLDKDMIIDGQGHTLTSTNKRYGFSSDRSVTFRNLTVNFIYDVEIENPNYAADLGIFYMNDNKNAQNHAVDITFENAEVNFTNTATGASNRLHAIYYDSCGGTVTLKNTTMKITGFPEDAIEWGGKQNSYIVIDHSTFISDHNRAGFTGTWNMTITDSDVQVLDSDGNGSNGANYTITNSTLTYCRNGAHGLSATDFVMRNSTVTSDQNNYYGVYVNGDFLVDSTSTLTVTNNSHGGDFAGLKLYKGVTDGKVEAGAVVTITGNYCSGLSNNGKCVFAEGSKLTITGNNNQQGGFDASHGGGIYNSGAAANLTLPSDAVIYNNHAATDGDDIYNSSNSTIRFPAVGSDWILDDCDHPIDGWYYDNEDSRWEVHDTYSATLFTDLDGGMASVSGLLCLKAAHSEGAILKPADITIYMGGEEGYEGVVNEAGTIVQNNSLPEPGYYITLSDEVNEVLQAAGYVDANNTPADLSGLITICTVGADKEYNWNLQKYGNTYSAAQGKYIYAITPVEGTNPFRLTFNDGEKDIDQDAFAPAEENTLQAQYQMDVYSELVNARKVFLKVSIPGQDTYYCNVTAQPGTLNVRYVTGNQDSVVTQAYTSVVQASLEDDPAQQALKKAYVIKDPGTRFFINESGVDVNENGFAQVSLLFDDVISAANTAGVSDYSKQLTDKAVQTAAADLVNVKTQAKYLDLVDANNGNVWLKPSKAVTVYWPYPEGTDAGTDFRLVHFEGLDRDMDTSQVAGQIASASAATVELKKDAYGISFTTDSFSPFVLVWGDQPAEEEESDQSEQTTTPTPVPTQAPTPAPTAVPTAAPAAAAVIPQTGDAMPVGLLGGVAVVAAAAFAALFVLRKRKHND